MIRFTHACFIRKNTPELREKLKDLGYNTDEVKDTSECIATSYVNSKAVGISEDSFDDANPHRTWNCAGRIDCKDNEELFLAIAALRNDSDINQWFKIPVLIDKETSIEYNEWFQAKEDGVTAEINKAIEEGEDKNSLPHKATVEELIEYFGYAEDNNKCS